MILEIPYGKAAQSLRIADGLDVEVLTAKLPPRTELSEQALVEEALAYPIASPPLAELAKGKKNAVIICSDHTRPVPSKAILPPMLAALREGNPAIAVTLLIATGCHRAPTAEELLEKLGREMVAREKIAVHCCESSEVRELGALPSGARLAINRLAAETELLLAEGFIEPHFFAGYSGGRKSVLPGVCARETVLGNHCAAFISDPCARTGILEGNPIHRDMTAAVEMAKLAFIVNTVLSADKRILKAFAGCGLRAHEAGCAYLDGLCRVTASRPADIVVTSNGGAPLDQNIYQAVKGMAAAEAVAAPGAVIIMAAECADGSGGEDFLAMLRDCGSPASLLKAIGAVPMEKTRPDQWQAQILARVLVKHRVILVCGQEARAQAEQMKLETAASLDEALRLALADRGHEARLTVIPDGVGVVAGLK